MADPTFFRQTGPAIAEATARLTAITADLECAYQRWEELESG